MGEKLAKAQPISSYCRKSHCLGISKAWLESSNGINGLPVRDYYGENSCTAGRSTFITGQVCLRTGLCKVGIPGATVGLQNRDATIAQALKPLGYATGQFGKNHLGDRDPHLPTTARLRRILR